MLTLLAPSPVSITILGATTLLRGIKTRFIPQNKAECPVFANFTILSFVKLTVEIGC